MEELPEGYARESDHPTAFMCAVNAEVERMTYKLNRTEEVSAVIYIMSHAGEGLRIRLIAASRYDCPKCEVAVQHQVGTDDIASHEKYVESFEELINAQEFTFADMLDRYWAEISDYQEEMVEKYARENDDLMAVLLILTLVKEMQLLLMIMKLKLPQFLPIYDKYV